MSPAAKRVLVLGGYGAFGGRITERLAQQADIELLVAGRSRQRAADFIGTLSSVRAGLLPLEVDAANIRAEQLAALGASLTINASGPYQRQGYGLAHACIKARAHYVDLADARAHVVGIGTLDAAAKSAGVLVVSGASTVPALSTAVVDAYAGCFANLEDVAVVISPGNSFDPGLATGQSIIGAIGQPISAQREGDGRAFGWMPLRRRWMPALGKRWTGACDVPDLDLLPLRYPSLHIVQVMAGLEVGAFHIGLWGLAWLVRGGLLRHPEKLARPLLAIKRRLGFLGSDRGGMSVTLEGRHPDGTPKRIDWALIATTGHGPYIPATPAVILAKRLLDGSLQHRGAMPCIGLFTLREFLEEIADLNISAGVA